MPDDRKVSEERKVKTLAIRLDTELHAQLSVIAQLRDSTVTDEIRQALSAHVASQAENGDLAGSAGSMLEDIEREAAARRDALSALLGSNGAAPTAARRQSGRKTTSDDSAAES